MVLVPFLGGAEVWSWGHLPKGRRLHAAGNAMAEETGRSAIDAYLDKVAEPARAALLKLRAQIRAAAPDATEYIGYGIPCFKQGRALVSYAAAKSHCSFFAMSPAVMAEFGADLAAYSTSKGTIRFSPERPLPATLVTRIVMARLAENAALDAAAKAKAGRRRSAG